MILAKRILILMNSMMTSSKSVKKDVSTVMKLLSKRAIRYKLSPDPEFATSPINIRDKDYDFSLDLSYISIVEKDHFSGTENESAMKHMNELAALSNAFSDDTKMRTYFITIFSF